MLAISRQHITRLGLRSEAVCGESLTIYVGLRNIPRGHFPAVSVVQLITPDPGIAKLAYLLPLSGVEGKR